MVPSISCVSLVLVLLAVTFGYPYDYGQRKYGHSESYRQGQRDVQQGSRNQHDRYNRGQLGPQHYGREYAGRTGGQTDSFSSPSRGISRRGSRTPPSGQRRSGSLESRSQIPGHSRNKRGSSLDRQSPHRDDTREQIKLGRADHYTPVVLGDGRRGRPSVVSFADTRYSTIPGNGRNNLEFEEEYIHARKNGGTKNVYDYDELDEGVAKTNLVSSRNYYPNRFEINQSPNYNSYETIDLSGDTKVNEILAAKGGRTNPNAESIFPESGIEYYEFKEFVPYHIQEHPPRDIAMRGTGIKGSVLAKPKHSKPNREYISRSFGLDPFGFKAFVPYRIGPNLPINFVEDTNSNDILEFHTVPFTLESELFQPKPTFEDILYDFENINLNPFDRRIQELQKGNANYFGKRQKSSVGEYSGDTDVNKILMAKGLPVNPNAEIIDIHNLNKPKQGEYTGDTKVNEILKSNGYPLNPYAESIDSIDKKKTNEPKENLSEQRLEGDLSRDTDVNKILEANGYPVNPDSETVDIEIINWNQPKIKGDFSGDTRVNEILKARGYPLNPDAEVVEIQYLNPNESKPKGEFSGDTDVNEILKSRGYPINPDAETIVRQNINLIQPDLKGAYSGDISVNETLKARGVRLNPDAEVLHFD